MGDFSDGAEQLSGRGRGNDALIKIGHDFETGAAEGELAILLGEGLVDAAEFRIGIGDGFKIELLGFNVVEADGLGAFFERFGELLGDVVDVLFREAEVMGVLGGFEGEEVISGKADVLATDDQIGETDQHYHCDIRESGNFSGGNIGVV